ncbi:MAG: UDP-N-acetylenolpyruvoylglucosamine reductase [Candidatus Aminicenantes bacterium 4484_214]|nr:MAG: UDP-N-acetylenolpyruvoylglucosamine reductase [Candidatus Aminicenantes bacterium 4484_214]RLE06148.1 MAG: UDP-N-acetylenolpyruvoylglucosamine reductase [Candidatus Aminicenantes bacterium]
MKKEEICEIFLQRVGKSLTTNEPLANHCHFQIGGPADFFFVATKEEEMLAVANLARECDLRFRVIGGGYNILFDDRGYRGLIIKNGLRKIQRVDSYRIMVHSGTELAELITFGQDFSLAGLEFLAGIPGTVGGAVYGNAGAFGHDIGECVESVRLLNTSGEIIEIETPHLQFSYRWSSLKNSQDIILSVKLKLKPGEKEALKARISEILKQRRNKLPSPTLPSGGSFFKNPLLPSGRKIAVAPLLEQVGAKGLRVGGAAVSQAHANFIYNLGGATAQDVLKLASSLKERIRRRFGLELEEEVIFLPEDA